MIRTAILLSHPVNGYLSERSAEDRPTQSLASNVHSRGAGIDALFAIDLDESAAGFRLAAIITRDLPTEVSILQQTGFAPELAGQRPEETEINGVKVRWPARLARPRPTSVGKLPSRGTAFPDTRYDDCAVRRRHEQRSGRHARARRDPAHDSAPGWIFARARPGRGGYALDRRASLYRRAGTQG
jgi:hypothetical protein